MPKAFVVMPFDDEFTPVYQQFIKPTLETAGFDVFRADDLRHQRSILRDIVEALVASDLVVADLTGGNENVFYELGFAHALEKPVILLAQDVDEVPFDLRGYRLIRYSTHFAEIDNATKALEQTAKGLLGGTVKFGNPMSDYKTLAPSDTRASAELRTAPGSTSPSKTGVPSDHRLVPENGEGAGFLDHVVAVEESADELTEIVKTVGNHTIRVGEATTNHSQQLASIQSGKQGRKISRHLAKEIDQFAADMSKNNDRYSDIASRFNNSLEFMIITFAVSLNDDSAEQREVLRTLLSSIEEMVESARDARGSFTGLQSAMESTPKIERFLSRAMARASAEVGRMVDNIDQTIAGGVRAVDLGRRLLGDSSESV